MRRNKGLHKSVQLILTPVVKTAADSVEDSHSLCTGIVEGAATLTIGSTYAKRLAQRPDNYGLVLGSLVLVGPARAQHRSKQVDKIMCEEFLEFSSDDQQHIAYWADGYAEAKNEAAIGTFPGQGMKGRTYIYQPNSAKAPFGGRFLFFTTAAVVRPALSGSVDFETVENQTRAIPCGSAVWCFSRANAHRAR